MLQPDMGKTALYAAAEEGHVDVVRLVNGRWDPPSGVGHLEVYGGCFARSWSWPKTSPPSDSGHEKRKFMRH